MNRIIAGLALFLLAAPAFAAASFDEAMALYDDRQYAAARGTAEAQAKVGNLRATVMMGLIFQKGQGVVADINTAVDWFAEAADRNDADAEYALAQIYLNGETGAPD